MIAKCRKLLATQREIAKEIVDNLRVKVSPDEKGLAKHYTESNEAYQLYLKGRFYWNKRTGEGLTRAIDYFNQAYGGYLESMNRLEEATAEEKRALQLDPLAPIQTFSLGLGFYYAHNYDKAIEYYQKTLQLDPNFPPAYSQLPAAYEQKRMYDQAIAGFQKGIALKSGGEWYFSLGGLGHVYAVSGRMNEARATLEELKRISEEKSAGASEYEYVRMDRIALIYAGLGDRDQAFVWLEKAYEERAFNLAWLNVDPRWDSLRPDPRFADLLKRIGLPP
jgi:tetratricopeptide (TPR) repeat protein